MLSIESCIFFFFILFCYICWGNLLATGPYATTKLTYWLSLLSMFYEIWLKSNHVCVYSNNQKNAMAVLVWNHLTSYTSMAMLVCNHLISYTSTTNLAAHLSTSYTKLVYQLITSQTSLNKLAYQVNPARPANDQLKFEAGSSWILQQGNHKCKPAGCTTGKVRGSSSH